MTILSKIDISPVLTGLQNASDVFSAAEKKLSEKGDCDPVLLEYMPQLQTAIILVEDNLEQDEYNSEEEQYESLTQRKGLDSTLLTAKHLYAKYTSSILSHKYNKEINMFSLDSGVSRDELEQAYRIIYFAIQLLK